MKNDFNKQKQQAKQVKMIGSTIGPAMLQTAKSGIKYCRSAIRDHKSGEIYVLMAFKELAAVLSSIAGGSKVSVAGRSSSSKGDENLIMLDYLTDESKELKAYQNSDSLRAESLEIEEYYRKKGYVPALIDFETRKGSIVKKKQYFPKAACIEVSPGNFKRKIDYAMDLLGPKEVERRLRAKLSSYGANSIFPPNGRGRDITALIDEMCEEVIF